MMFMLLMMLMQNDLFYTIMLMVIIVCIACINVYLVKSDEFTDLFRSLMFLIIALLFAS